MTLKKYRKKRDFKKTSEPKGKVKQSKRQHNEASSLLLTNKNNNLSNKITNPNKILYPEDKITKHDIAAYYETVQDWILPYIINRPLTLVRCPEGYKKCFYQKHINNTTPPQLLSTVTREKNAAENFIYIKNSEGLMALPQMGCLEIHTWGSTIEKMDYPDTIVFDLDPAENLKWTTVVDAAFEIKKYLHDFKLKSFIKTTGGKGLHIVIPIKPGHDWEAIKLFTHSFVDFMVMQNPKKYISQMTKSKRVGKIYLDYLRNQKGATAISPYSTRARIHAPVATPLHWDELTYNKKDTFYTIHTLPKRLASMKKDPWKGFYEIKQRLNLKKS